MAFARIKSRLLAISYPVPTFMPVSGIDILRAANVLLKRHGRDATIVSAMKVDECLAVGDLEGRMIWKRIVEAMLELLKDKPEQGEHLDLAPMTERPRDVG